MDSRGTPCKDGTVVRLLWIAGRLPSFRRISRDVACREYGISQRTWMRDLHRLRNAGFILILQRPKGDHHFAYGGFDPDHAEAVRMGPYEPRAKEKAPDPKPLVRTLPIYIGF
jgi:hypothetical protein